MDRLYKENRETQEGIDLESGGLLFRILDKVIDRFLIIKYSDQQDSNDEI